MFQVPSIGSEAWNATRRRPACGWRRFSRRLSTGDADEVGSGSVPEGV